MSELVQSFARVRALPWTVGGALFALVVAWTMLATPRYRSTALLQVEGERSGSAAFSEVVSSIPGGSLLGLGTDELETQVGVLRSRRVVDAVIDSLGLTVRVLRPREAKAEIVIVEHVAVANAPGARADVDGELVLRRGDGDTWSVTGRELSKGLSLPATLGADETLRVGEFAVSLAPALLAGDAREVRLQLLPRYAVRAQIEKRLDVRRQSAGAQLIALSFDDPDATIAAKVLERMLAEYLDFATRAARGDAGTTVAELRRQIEGQQERLTAAEEELRRYQERTGLVVPEEQAAAQVKRYATLRAALDLVEVERDALERLVELVASRVARDPSTAAYRQLATFPSLITNRAIQDLLQALLSLENDRSALRVSRAESNADVRQLTERIAEIERQLERLGRQYLESLDGQIVPTRAALAAIDAELLTLPDRELRFIRLLRERTILQEGYLALQKQLRITEVQDALRLDEVRVVDAPTVAHPDNPHFPRVPVHLVLALVLALAGGGAVAATQAAIRASATTH